MWMSYDMPWKYTAVLNFEKKMHILQAKTEASSVYWKKNSSNYFYTKKIHISSIIGVLHQEIPTCGALIYVEDWLLWEDSIGHGFAGWALFDDFSKHDKRDDTKSCKEVEGHSVRRNGFVHNALYIHKRRGNCGPASQLAGFSRLLIWQLPMVSCAC